MGRLTDSKIAAIQPPRSGQDEHADDLIIGLRLRVGAGGRKAWIVRTRAGGKPINKTIGVYPTMRLNPAREAAREFLLSVAKNGVPRSSRTFGDLADHWIENVAKPNNKSWHNQKRRLDIHVLPAWRERDVDSIQRADVRELIDGIEGEVAPKYVLTAIRTLFRYAMSRDWVDASPAEGMSTTVVETPRDRFLDMEEVKRAYRTADLLGYPMGGFFKMLFLTAQRRGEVAAMRWDQVNLDAATWVLESADTKSARSHLVPLSPQAVALLRSTPRLGPFIWSTDGETHVKGFSKSKAALDRFIAVAAGHPLRPWRVHDIRRTVATHLVRLGITETIVGRVLNHAAQGVTARTYALHSYEPEKRSALARWGAEIERLVAQKPEEKVVSLR